MVRSGRRNSRELSDRPHSMVEVKDLQSGDVTAVAHRPE